MVFVKEAGDRRDRAECGHMVYLIVSLAVNQNYLVLFYWVYVGALEKARL